MRTEGVGIEECGDECHACGHARGWHYRGEGECYGDGACDCDQFTLALPVTISNTSGPALFPWPSAHTGLAAGRALGLGGDPFAAYPPSPVARAPRPYPSAHSWGLGVDIDSRDVLAAIRHRIQCAVCRHPVDLVETDRNPASFTTFVRFRCHGHWQEVAIDEEVVEDLSWPATMFDALPEQAFEREAVEVAESICGFVSGLMGMAVDADLERQPESVSVPPLHAACRAGFPG